MPASEGHVYIVGAGPGDPGLITVAGARALARAGVVLYDALAPASLLRHASPGAEVRYVGKRAGQHALSQADIESLAVRLARSGKIVVRLKGGDPFVFGRGSEEAMACARAGVPFTVIPGISSAIAAPAYAGIPVTHRGVAASFMVITGSESGPGEPGATVDWKAAAGTGTLSILMGGSTLGEAMSRLMASGKEPSTPAACVRWGTRPDQQVVKGTVATIAALAASAGLSSPLVTVVGPVVDLAGEIAWFSPGPLAGRTVVVTRAREQANGLAETLEELGATVVEAPIIRIQSIAPNGPLRKALLERPAWVVFTSANAVRACVGELLSAGADVRELAASRIAAVGPGTAAALAEAGLRPDFVPPSPAADSLAAALPGVDGRRVLLPLSALADDRLARGLCERGALVQQHPAYDTIPAPLDEERVRQVIEADAITFTSASTARFLRQAIGEAAVHSRTRLVSIGPQTSEAVVDAFGRVDREAASPDLESLAHAVREALAWA